MRPTRAIALLLVLLAAARAAAQAGPESGAADSGPTAEQEATEPARVGGMEWSNRRPGGFFFYQDPAPRVAVPAAPPPAPKPPPAEARTETPQAPLAREEPIPTVITTAWIRGHLQDYMDRAIDDPTPNNVQAFLALQQIAMAKSTQFAKATNALTIGNPLFDYNFVRPSNTMGGHALDEQAQINRKAVLSKLGQTVGIWYFFRSDCPYCAKQGPVLQEFIGRSGVHVLPISLDGGPPPSGEFGGYVKDRGQAAGISPAVEATPSLYLAKPATGETAAISQGLLSLDQLEERVITAAHTAKFITDQEYASCQPEKEENYDVIQQRLRDVVASTPLPDHHDPVPQSAAAAPEVVRPISPFSLADTASAK